MSEHMIDLSSNAMINLNDYEIVPEPSPDNETPRQFISRMTGHNVDALSHNGRDFTWKEVKDIGLLPLIAKMLQVSPLPRIVLRKKGEP